MTDAATLLDEAVRAAHAECPCAHLDKETNLVCCGGRRCLWPKCEWWGHARITRAVALARLAQAETMVSTFFGPADHYDGKDCLTRLEDERDRLRREAEALGDV